MRRYTRLTNGIRKAIEMHTHAVAPHFMNYYFVNLHDSLGVTSTMAAGATDRLWEVGDVVDLLIAEEEDRTARV